MDYVMLVNDSQMVWGEDRKSPKVETVIVSL